MPHRQLGYILIFQYLNLKTGFQPLFFVRIFLAKGTYFMREVTYEITKEIGVLSVSRSGWSKELNMVSWNGGREKFDLREWSDGHDKMSKGITLSEEEAMKLFNLLSGIFND